MEARVYAYEIKRLGYYPDSEDVSTKKYTDYSELLKLLVDWAGNQSDIENTSTYNVSKSRPESNLYYADGYFDEDSGDSTFVMWRELRHDSGKVASISKTSKPGVNIVNNRKVSSSKEIPGCPSYFWFNNSEQMLYAVVFKHSAPAKKQLCDYLEGFLKFYSPTSNLTSKADAKRLSYKGYRDIRENPPVVRGDTHVEVELDYKTLRKIREFLVKNIAKIKAVHEEHDIAYLDDAEKTKLQSMLRFITGKKEREAVDAGKVSIEIPWVATEQRIDELVGVIKQQSMESSAVKDIKVVISGRSSVSIFESAVKSDIELNVQRKANEYIKAVTLFEALDEARNKVQTELNF